MGVRTQELTFGAILDGFGQDSEVDEPEARLRVAETNDGCDAVFDDAGIASVEQNVITPVVAELTKGDEGGAKVGLYGGGTGTAVEGDGQMAKIQVGGVGRCHNLTVRDANTQTVSGGDFGNTRRRAGDKGAGAA
jgi:hypothetical protein